MLIVPGYTFLDELYTNQYEWMGRYLRLFDEKNVILKSPRSDSPSNREITSLEHEYYLLTHLASPNIIQAYQLIQSQLIPILELENIEGETLDHYLKGQPLPLAYFFTIALQLVDLLAVLHQNHIIHKDIKPANIIINPSDFKIKLVDLSVAIQVTEDIQEQNNLDLPEGMIEGTLAYMSPEQTGRMNRPIDYRSDLYSLGVTFFEMLTGELPFRDEDPLELAYNHIAKLPPLVSELNPEIPEMIEKLITKLLSKAPEERYAHTMRLKSDLKKCAIQWEEKKKIDNFELGQHDIQDKLQFSHKLYGRETQIKMLLNTFDVVSQGASKLMLISGHAGIGKTSVIYEIHKPITRQRGFFIKGKFDQLQKATPYSAVVNVFQDLVKQVLSEPEKSLRKIKQNLLTALGINAQVIIDVIPKVELLIGPQEAAPIFNPTESQNRFYFVFQSFVQVFAQSEHPLVIFLDDLQWADNASLKLIESLLLKFNTRHLFIIGAYRDNEVDANHPLSNLLDKFRESEIPVQILSLNPLTQWDVEELLMDLFTRSQESVEQLAKLLINKTHGNPFFINEFIKTLYKNKLIYFSYEEEKWHWDVLKIEQQSITDNVVELLSEKIHHLTKESQQTLKLAACIGHTFDLHTLAAIREQPLTKTAIQLGEARAESLIVPIGDVFRSGSEASRMVILLEENYEIKSEVRKGKLIYRFEHDRIHQAAYGLIPKEERQQLHFRIGRLLLKDKPLEENDERLFSLLDHLNQGLSFLTDPNEKQQLVHYNLWAGKKARLSTAYQEARVYFEAAMTCLAHDAWENQYSSTIILFQLYIECLYLLGDFAKAEQSFNIVESKTKDPLEMADLYLIRIRAYSSVARHPQAIEYATRALGLLDFHLPSNVSRFHILYEFLRIRLLIGTRPINELDKYLVPIAKKQDIAIAKLLNSIIPSSFLIANSNLLALIICTLVRLSLTKGYNEETSYVYLNFASILVAQFDKMTTGFDFVSLAEKLETKMYSKELACRNNFMIGTFLDAWRHHALNSVSYLQQSFKLSLEIGNLEYATYAQRSAFIYFYTGKKLSELDIETQRYIDFSARMKNQIYHSSLSILYNISQYLQEGPAAAKELEKNLQTLAQQDNKSIQTVAYVLYSVFLYLIDDFSNSQKYAALFHKMKISIKGVILDSAFGWLMLSWTIIKSYPTANKTTKKAYLKQLLSNQRKFKKWASYSPTNFQFMYFWISAEVERLQGNFSKAASLYNKAIVSAQENEYIAYVGAICESAAQYYLDLQNTICAESYIKRAHFAYRRWGANYKCQLLKQKYPQLMTAIESFDTGIITRPEASALTAQAFDIAAIMKSSQAIAGEIKLEKLLETLLKNSMENAGAQKGVLVFEQEKKLIVVAESSDDNVISVHIDGIPLEKYNNLPKSILNYVWQAHENLLLNAKTEMGQFQQDPYILANQPNSILCVPILLHGHATSYLYLENRLTPYAFTPERLHILRLLGGQSAISLENAKLYSAIGRFVPYEFLHWLKKSNLTELQLGDHIEREMTVLFCDIRNFTSISENFTPAEVFQFINDIFGYLEPDIRRHHGFVDKYIGDAIMALFERAEDAVKAGLDMLKTLDQFNNEMTHYPSINIGIGINTGKLMMGIIGQKNRIEGSVLGDAVNVASRVQSLTKQYGEALLISEATRKHLHTKAFYFKAVGEVKVKGKVKPVMIFSVYPPHNIN